MTDGNRAYALDLKDRDNLDPEMTAVVKGMVKKYGFMPNYLKFWKTDNMRLRNLIVPTYEHMRPDNGLTNLETEMINLVSAQTNGCVYCMTHHSMLVRAETDGDTRFAEYLSRNYKLADLSDRHRTMLDFVVKVLTDAENITEDDRQGLRDVGYDDEAIWTIISTTTFNAMTNRMAQAVGLRITPEYLEMYREPKNKKAQAAE